MTAKINKPSPQKAKESNIEGRDWTARKQKLEHRIKALKKIIEQLNEEGKDKKQTNK